MTENDIKEDISRSFLEIIANRKGFYNLTSRRDYGVDIRYTKATKTLRGRYLEQPLSFAIQLKATTEKWVTVLESYVKFALEAKTYNDLVERAYTCQPLVLVLFILPEDTNEWVNLTSNELVVKKCAYWFAVDKGTLDTENTDKITISIPKTNLIDFHFFDNLYHLYRQS